MKSENILVKIKDNIALVTLNRPEVYNAFDDETLKLFAQIMVELGSDNEIKAVIITGNGKAFSSGGDLKAVSSYEKGAPSAFYQIAHYLHLGMLEIRKMSKPVIAAINGPTAGGGFSLALACDFRIMAKSAIMKQAYTSAGLSIDGGGTFSLPRLVGFAKALEIAYLDEKITSDQAKEIGLVTQVVENKKLLETAMELAKKFNNISLNSFGMSKRLFNDSFANTFEKQIELEREALVSCSRHDEGKEGLKAFIEKRKPVFN